MTYKPILFNTPMVCAIEDGTKTQTRRLINVHDDSLQIRDVFMHPDLPCTDKYVARVYGSKEDEFDLIVKTPCVPGDVLWVRETWKPATTGTAGPGLTDLFLFKADEPQDTTGMMVAGCWRPAIHMPKEAARIFLRVQNVQPKRLQDITIQGLQEEGVLPSGFLSQYATMTSGVFERWAALWNSTIPKGKLAKCGWDANPWVWVIRFTRMEKPEGWPNV